MAALFALFKELQQIFMDFCVAVVSVFFHDIYFGGGDGVGAFLACV